MSLQSVRDHLASVAPDIEILESSESTATVDLAASAHGVVPGQIAKTLALWVGDTPVLLVLRGDAKLDNRKYKDAFGTKAKMLAAEDVVSWTGHPVGGVCPFGLPSDLRVYTDVSLRDHAEVLPAAGATNTALRITPDRMAALVAAEWVDVAKDAAA